MAGYFSIFLVLLTLGSGLIWLIDHFMFAPKRQQRIALAQNAAGGELDEETAALIAPEPSITETAKSIFPMIAAITIFRSLFLNRFKFHQAQWCQPIVGDFILYKSTHMALKTQFGAAS